MFFSAHRCAFLRDPPMSMTPQPHSSKRKVHSRRGIGRRQCLIAPSLYNYISYCGMFPTVPTPEADIKIEMNLMKKESK